MMQTTLILGLGKSGQAAAWHALKDGDEVTIYVGARNAANETAAAQFADENVNIVFDSEDVEGSYDLCVVSPGIPQTGDFYKSAASAARQIISEPEYAWRISPRDWIAVTGTNGKTTTTSLITHLINTCGKNAVACGNIGDTTLSAVEARTDSQVLVAEMSSFQLASTVDFAPRVAVLLNITPDHIAWHGSFVEYALSKFKVFENMDDGGVAVITREIEAGYPEQIAKLEQRGVAVLRACVQSEANCAFVDADNVLCIVDALGIKHELIATSELNIKGSHNIENALASAAACYALGCDIADIVSGLKSFMPLEHRIEPCGTVADVDFFNDSKATNVDATLKALTAFSDRTIVLLLGGRDKGTDLRELVGACTGVVSAVVAYGEAGQRFFDAFEPSSISVFREDGMRKAFERACELARPGQAIVLSPACASFDEFDSFEQRGSVFKEYVREFAAMQG